MADLKVAVEIGARDRFSGPAAKVRGAAGKLQGRFQAAESELKAFGRQRAALDSLARLEKGLGRSSAALDAARKRTAALRAEVRATANPSKKLVAEFERSKAASSKLGAAHAGQRSRLRQLRSEMAEAGFATGRLSDAQAELDRRMQSASARMDQARSASDALAARQAASARSRGRLAHTALALQGAGNIGRAAMRALTGPAQAYRGVAAARGDLQSLGLDPDAARAISERGRQVSLQIPGISAEGFTLAAYDIQSGIEGLSTEGVAGLTEASAVTARATKGDVTATTGLMATLHSVFKDALHSELSDAQFGWAAAGQLSAAVREFKTTGPRMQQAIQSAGSKLALSGVSMAEQFAALGLLQGKMEPGKAGTALDAFARTAAVAEGRLRDSGRSVRLLDEAGNLLPLTRAMENLRQAFGEDLVTREQAEIAKAFGSEEAAEAIAALWKAGEDQAAAVASLQAAGADGERFSRAMQARRDDNEDARLQLLSQRWDNLMLTAGESLVGTLERLAPSLERMIGGVEWAAEKFPAATSAVVVLGAGFAAVTAAAGLAAPSLIALAFAANQARAWMDGRRIARGVPPGTGAPGGKPPRGGLFGKLAGYGGKLAGRVPALGKAAPLAKAAAHIGGRALPFAPAALGVAEIGLAAFDSTAAPGERSGRIASAAGGVAGATGGGLAGAKLGALVGTAVFPGAGTAIGAALGGLAGAIGGDSLGRTIASWLHGESPEKGEAAGDRPEALALPAIAEGARTVNMDVRIDVRPRPGESEESLARRVLEELRRLQGEAEQEAAFDAS